jgi:hypothetical protein
MQEVSGVPVGSSTHASRIRTMQNCGTSCSVPVATCPFTGETSTELLGRVDAPFLAYVSIPNGSNRPTITRTGTSDRTGVATTGSPRPAAHTPQAPRNGLCPYRAEGSSWCSTRTPRRLRADSYPHAVTVRSGRAAAPFEIRLGQQTKPGRNGRASLFPRDASSEGARRDRADRGSPAAAAPAPEPAGLGRRGTERRRSSG